MNNKKQIILPSIEEIIEINKSVEGKIINRGSLDFLMSKIESKFPKKDFKKQVSAIAAILWYDITINHPFLDGNKRTAMETMQLFLYKNGFRLETTMAGLVYISLKIANNEINYAKLVKWVYERIKEVEK